MQNICSTTDEEGRFELFLLGPGEKKVTWVTETREWNKMAVSSLHVHLLRMLLPGVPNAARFTFNKEDHTLGNLISSRLRKYKTTVFSGYMVPHPLVPSFELRVQTDGTITPKAAVLQACRDIVQDLDHLSKEFTKEWELKKIANTGGDA